MAVTTAAVVAIAATAASTGMSFAQAGKQRNAMRNAERDADAAMQTARKKLEVNFYDNLGIQKEPYELEREALLSQGAQAIQAGVESERGAAATAGRIQMAQQEGQAGVRSAFGQELTALERLSAQEDSRLRDVGIQLDLGEVEGAQLAAANAQELAAQATQQGMQGVTSLTQQVSSFVPLYEKDASARQFSKLQSDYEQAAKAGKLSSTFMEGGKAIPFQQAIQAMGKNTGGIQYGFDVSGLGAMQKNPFEAYMIGQSAENLKAMRGYDFSK